MAPVFSQSHMEITTRTGNQGPDSTGPNGWDQVTAMSQTMINKGLEELYKKSPDMQKMYDLNNIYGKIEAEFDAPTVIVPGADQLGLRNNIIFQIRFKTGKLYDPNGDVLIDNLGGWILADKVDLLQAETSLKILSDSVKTLKEQLKAEQERKPQDAKKIKTINIKLSRAIRSYENVINYFEVPGDYSIHRLFLKLTCKSIPQLKCQPHRALAD